ncbi:MAG: hypothetical protein Q4B09_00500 [Lachnospiraceae bacterium]|nr:hypothetical protein [Lachnospiraceae bacterium]
MEKLLKDLLNKIASYTEIMLAFFLTIVVVFISARLVVEAFTQVGSGSYELEYYLRNALTLAIGVEFVKMLSTHTPTTIIEVLLFATARQIVMDHSSIVNTLLGVVAIAGLFAIRKYLFSYKDELDHVILRASYTVGHANFIAKTKIPEPKGKLLRDVMLQKLEEEGKTPAIGACVHYRDCALRIDHIHNDVITRIEVIRTL